MTDILYICNKKRSCSDSPRCGNECKHTVDPKYALHGVCKYPWLHPEKFKPDIGPHGIFFIEQEKRSEKDDRSH